ncbi:diaminopimelate epimerase [Arthrobacter sp. LAPM80]|uniref:diaminopimelate epimerase n=1 Tax=Arthrobacter sp. LAPM80 TaxID=3141788 RepID=UPI00398B7FF7
MTDAPTPLTGLRFSKGHGTGNDFVLMADPDGDRLLSPQQIAAVCDRHRGIGGDGLIRAVRSRHVPEGAALLAAHPGAEWFMDYNNADGSQSEMCGNGVRVFVHFLLTQGLVELEQGRELAIGTRAGVKVVSRTDGGYRVDMGPWDFIFPQEARERGADSRVDADGLAGTREALSITMGNPHTVVALSEMAELAGTSLVAGPAVSPLPPHGTNVEFAVRNEPLESDGVGYISMRVHERGVGETLSCGTGACAAAAAVRFRAGKGAPDDWSVEIPGGTVGVEFFPGPDGREHVALSGPAVMVAEGVIADGLFG